MSKNYEHLKFLSQLQTMHFGIDTWTSVDMMIAALVEKKIIEVVPPPTGCYRVLETFSVFVIDDATTPWAAYEKDTTIQDYDLKHTWTFLRSVYELKVSR